MTAHLWSVNTLENFWQPDPMFPSDVWEQAIQTSLPSLRLKRIPVDEDDLLKQVLGEDQFGTNHWQLSRMRRLYYVLKPFIPRMVSRTLRRILQSRHKQDFELSWPIEERYPRFQFDVLKTALELSGMSSVCFAPFWPQGRRFAFVLTHDIEEEKGQRFVCAVMELEESLGFHSLFNFVPERYRVDRGLMNDIRARGFEVGVHGLKHDGKLFRSHSEFMRRAERINHYLTDYSAAGFRSPLTHRQPEWMQTLEIEYDLSFFDTDPFEPMPGGVMSVHPFFIGRFIELPYTLAQDHTLTAVLGESTPRLWLEKVDRIETYHGMALVNVHPDYLRTSANFNLYADFLQTMKNHQGYWHALPRDVAAWWRHRTDKRPRGEMADQERAIAVLRAGQLSLELPQGIHSYAPMS